jgi:hypothetical protein
MTEVLKTLPNPMRPKTLREDPLLNCVLKLKLLPKLEKFRTEIAEPNLPKDLTLSVEPK